jgi:hypothetical protein
VTLLLLFGAQEGGEGGSGGSSASSDNVPYSGSAYYARNMSVMEAEAWVEKNLALLEVTKPPPDPPQPPPRPIPVTPQFGIGFENFRMPIMNMPQAKAAPPKPKFEWWKQ